MIDEAELQFAGFELAQLLVDWSWVIRRVEHIGFYDDVAYRRTVRVDFDATALPVVRLGSTTCRLAPLTLLSKQTVTNLDYSNGSGDVVSVLTARDEGLIATGILVKTAYAVIRERDPDATLSAPEIADLRVIATAAPTAAVAMLESVLGQTPRTSIYTQLASYTPFVVLARALAHSVPLVIPIEQAAEPRQTITFTHDTLVRRTRAVDTSDSSISRVRVGLLGTMVRSVGWTEHQYWFVAPSIGRGGTFHLVVEVPLGLKVTMQSLLPFARDATRTIRRLRTVSVSGTMHKARLYVPDVPPGTIGVATVGIRARLSTTIFPTAMMAVGSVIVLLVGVLALHKSKAESLDVGAAAVLVPLLPTLAAGYVARGAEEHRLTSVVVWGVRLLALLVGACTFGAAASLAITTHRHTNLVAWTACLLIAAVATVAVCVTAARTYFTAEAGSREGVTGNGAAPF